MTGGPPGPDGWQVLWAGAGHGFLIQTRTQEWRKGEFAVGKLDLLNNSDQKRNLHPAYPVGGGGEEIKPHPGRFHCQLHPGLEQED